MWTGWHLQIHNGGLKCKQTKKYIYTYTLYAHNLHSYFFSVNTIKFNWVGANTKDVVLLNDLNYSEEADEVNAFLKPARRSSTSL